MKNRRAIERTPLRLEAVALWGTDQRPLLGLSADLSTAGVLLQLPGPVPVGRRLDVVIRCGSPKLIVATSGIVMHSRQAGARFHIGLRFARQSERTTELLQQLLSDMRRSA